MKTNRTVPLPREELDRLASAFNAIAVVIEHCDSVCAGHVARIFEQYVYDAYDRAEQADSEGGEA